MNKDGYFVVDGNVMGYIMVDFLRDPILFPIAPYDEFILMNEDEKEVATVDAKNESGLVEFGVYYA